MRGHESQPVMINREDNAFFLSLSFLPVDSAVYSMNLLGVCTQWEEIAVSSRNKNQPSTAGGWEGEEPSV